MEPQHLIDLGINGGILLAFIVHILRMEGTRVKVAQLWQWKMDELKDNRVCPIKGEHE